jgi:hypothetical protein
VAGVTDAPRQFDSTRLCGVGADREFKLGAQAHYYSIPMRVSSPAVRTTTR